LLVWLLLDDVDAAGVGGDIEVILQFSGDESSAVLLGIDVDGGGLCGEGFGRFGLILGERGCGACEQQVGQGFVEQGVWAQGCTAG